MEARGVPGLMKARSLSTEHSQSGVHRPSEHWGKEAVGVAAISEVADSGDEKCRVQSSVGFMPAAQSQSQWHWFSAQGWPRGESKGSWGCLVGSVLWVRAKMSSELLVQPQSQSEKHVPSEHGLPLVHANGVLPMGPVGFGMSGIVGGGIVPLLDGRVIVPLLQEVPTGHAIISLEARL